MGVSGNGRAHVYDSTTNTLWVLDLVQRTGVYYVDHEHCIQVTLSASI
ncbi:BZ3500_MvSof-1268-A1-R1_Chr4-1g06792 [Microbotryum saponariae]|uniref:BZ3500_MvSof-1268-A1-R1_Chr4-1g06792 protein n=1 Tax=Microbotryum saponariae TaxID=289078 RepID=A0A2X0LKL9_9BASI|nr:BZ3500_MvSof-1268-A1-R1_Chr4-1g06792 [Microbotryum saponariae]SDA06449.1 BZ3501_MvSof-1269-A2-R1_Chr4-1g06494 [Microbotryum saponariae]